jgi:hypothetical protein
VIGRAKQRAKKKKAGPISHNKILAAIGKVVPCRKWGGWSGDGGDFERGVYGLVNARQVPAPKKLHVYTAVWNSLGFRSLVSGAEQQKTMYHAVVLSLRYKIKPSTFGKQPYFGMLGPKSDILVMRKAHERSCARVTAPVRAA